MGERVSEGSRVVCCSVEQLVEGKECRNGEAREVTRLKMFFSGKNDGPTKLCVSFTVAWCMILPHQTPPLTLRSLASCGRLMMLCSASYCTLASLLTRRAEGEEEVVGFAAGAEAPDPMVWVGVGQAARADGGFV